MLKWLFNQSNRLVLFFLTISAALLTSTLSFSAVTYTVPRTVGVEITWDHNEPLPEGYRVFQRKEGQEYDYTQPVWTGADNSSIIYNLEYDTTYYFVVRAFQGMLEGENSEEIPFMAPTPEPVTYSITATSGGYGSIAPAGETPVIEGADQTYAVMPESGYHIADVKIDGVSKGAIASYAFTDVTGDHSIAAIFEADTPTSVGSSGVDANVSDESPSNPNENGSNAVSIQIEAEDGNLVWPMEIGDNDDASASGYVWVPTDNKEEGGFANYFFEIPKDGEYVIWARQASNDSNSDSFILNIDNQSDMIWHTIRGGTDVWTWDVVSERAVTDARETDNPVYFHFTAGLHSLTVKQAETGTKLDKILITDQIELRSPVQNTEVKKMEFGDVEIDHNWTRVNFEKQFVNPVVIAGPLTYKGGQPAVVRVKDVDTTGFDIRVQEWDYLDGAHVTETVSYMVMEQGTYTLEDGTVIEARNLDVSAVKNFQMIAFQGTFNLNPIVMTTLTSYNDASAVTGRVRQITTAGFGYRMQEQEANALDHGKENLSYIAWEPSSGAVGDIRYLVETTTNEVMSDNHDILFDHTLNDTPAVLADMQTSNGGNTASVRCSHKDASSFGVLVTEEASKDEELDHIAEAVGYVVLSH